MTFKPHEHKAVMRVTASVKPKSSSKFSDAKITWSISASIRSSLRMPFYSVPTAGLRRLDRLPVEVLSMIVLNMDVRSCLAFRSTNRNARQIVSHLREYTVVATHAVEAIQTIVKTDVCGIITIGDVYRLLCSKSCHLCLKDGRANYISLPLIARICYDCHCRHPVKMVSAASLASLSRIPRKTMTAQRHLPIFRITGNRGRGSRATELVTMKSALDMLKRLGRCNPSMTVQGVAALPVPFFTPLKQFESFYQIRLIAPLTKYNSVTREAERWYKCNGCELAERKAGRGGRYKVYLREEFLKHAGQCSAALDLWKLSRQGTVDVRKTYSHIL